jgi:hypothetical protein
MKVVGACSNGTVRPSSAVAIASSTLVRSAAAVQCTLNRFMGVSVGDVLMVTVREASGATGGTTRCSVSILFSAGVHFSGARTPPLTRSCPRQLQGLAPRIYNRGRNELGISPLVKHVALRQPRPVFELPHRRAHARKMAR